VSLDKCLLDIERILQSSSLTCYSCNSILSSLRYHPNFHLEVVAADVEFPLDVLDSVPPIDEL